MTARSELFILEEVASEVEMEEDCSIIIPDNWKEIWDDSMFPDKGEAIVVKNGKKIGKISWKVRFEIEGDESGRFIVAYPEDVVFEGVK